jgi:glycosyltransferase involved in cell wall biosynthesis
LNDLDYEGSSFIAYPPKILNLPLGILRAAKFLQEQRIDIVHCDDGPLRYIWFYASKMAGVRYVHVQRTLVRKTLEKILSYRMADAVISNSKATQGSLPSLPDQVLQEVICPPIEFKYAPEDKAKNRQDLLVQLGLEKSVKLVGFAANIHSRKRPEIFIQAAALLKGENIKFIMAGNFYGDMERQLKALVKKYQIENNVIFLGFVSDAQRIISGFDVLITPAVNEAFGRTLVEAIGLGTPVIASNSGGHREIIEDGINGFLVPPDNPEIWAKKISDVLQNGFSISNSSQTTEKFSKEKIVKAFEDVYDKVAR